MELEEKLQEPGRADAELEENQQEPVRTQRKSWL